MMTCVMLCCLGLILCAKNAQVLLYLDRARDFLLDVVIEHVESIQAFQSGVILLSYRFVLHGSGLLVSACFVMQICWTVNV